MNDEQELIFARLEAGMRARLTLVNGEAAENALRAWAAVPSRLVAWLQLAPEHNVDNASLEDAVAGLLNALIAAPAIHAAVGLMLDYPPPQMHLYLAGASEPPLPLARLRVRRQLVKIAAPEDQAAFPPVIPA